MYTHLIFITIAVCQASLPGDLRFEKKGADRPRGPIVSIFVLINSNTFRGRRRKASDKSKIPQKLCGSLGNASKQLGSHNYF